MSLESLMQSTMAENQYLPEADVTVTVAPLTEEERTEVVAFLAERPVHTVIMAGYIRDNGIVSPHNRGTFYGCRNSEGRLEGVALIGHATLIDARTRRATQEFALIAQFYPRTHMMMGERDRIEQFWNFYADDGQPMRRVCRELLFELKHRIEVAKELKIVRLATPDDLDLIAPVHAQMAYDESGVNPLEVDPEGFRKRCLRRIEMQRVYVVIKDGELIFKTDVQAETPDVIYLEGIYVNPKYRGQGIGRACLMQLNNELLNRTKTICLLVNECNERAHAFYRLCGYKLTNIYDTIFLSQQGRENKNVH